MEDEYRIFVSVLEQVRARYGSAVAEAQRHNMLREAQLTCWHKALVAAAQPTASQPATESLRQARNALNLNKCDEERAHKSFSDCTGVHNA